MTFPPLLTLSARIERWPLAQTFSISRGSKNEAVVVVVELGDGRHKGRGECVPYERYGETPDGVVAAIKDMRDRIERGLDRNGLLGALPAGSARNAIDCALWDYEAKASGIPAYARAGLGRQHPLVTAYTISLDTPERMAAAAKAVAERPLLKIKLGREGDGERLTAVRKAAPKSKLIVDANEGWTPENLAANLEACAAAGVLLVEQPLPAGDDHALGAIRRRIPICADESAHDRASLLGLVGKYDAVNIKLDKAGGLTEAFALAADARARGFGILAGCMVATSLAMAPATLIAQTADLVDLDGPLLLARDRPDGLSYQGHMVHPPEPALWG